MPEIVHSPWPAGCARSATHAPHTHHSHGILNFAYSSIFSVPQRGRMILNSLLSYPITTRQGFTVLGGGLAFLGRERRQALSHLQIRLRPKGPTALSMMCVCSLARHLPNGRRVFGWDVCFCASRRTRPPTSLLAGQRWSMQPRERRQRSPAVYSAFRPPRGR